MENTVIPTAQMTGMHTTPAGYRAARRLEITAMEEITKAAEAITILVIKAAIIEGQVP
ncbi:MAG: hypothetical protein K2M70_05725 [Lachnospiraceae bacterium]|nr:hypothetical protein [Lachnospiraceae bacterium]